MTEKEPEQPGLPELEEISEADYIKRGRTSVGREAVFFFTPMCGTCKLAERMLQVTLAAGSPVPIRKLNINFAPQLREAWRIASVPCLVLVRNGVPAEVHNAISGVDQLFRLLKRFGA